MNYETSNSGKGFIRGESRGGNDWKTLERLRKKWDGILVVKGVMNSADAEKIKKSGADAVYVSNHGGRQLDSAPASIYALPLIRKAVGKDYPIIFDSGIRGGGDILKALALGANFVMLGRPLMYAIGADGASGLRKILDVIKGELSTSLGLVGLDDIKKVSNSILAEDFIHKQRKTLDY
jgi:L-lactate dehydrogenase (cytochrome)